MIIERESSVAPKQSATMADTASPEKSAIDTSSMEKNVAGGNNDPMFGDLRNADGSSLRSGEDILSLQDLDPALNMKMHLVNNVSDTRALL